MGQSRWQTCLGGFGSTANRVSNCIDPTKILQRDECTFPCFLPIKIKIQLSLLSSSSFFCLSPWFLHGGGITGTKPNSRSSGLFMVDVTGAPIHVSLGSLFTPLPSMQSFPLQGFWCWPDLVDRTVGGMLVNQHLPDSIAFIIILSSQIHALSIVTCYCNRLRCTTLLQP